MALVILSTKALPREALRRAPDASGLKKPSISEGFPARLIYLYQRWVPMFYRGRTHTPESTRFCPDSDRDVRVYPRQLSRRITQPYFFFSLFMITGYLTKFFM